MFFLMTVNLNSIFAFADENTNLLIFVITAGSGSGDSQHKKIKNLQKDLDYQREKVMELEKELKMVRNFPANAAVFRHLLFISSIHAELNSACVTLIKWCSYTKSCFNFFQIAG